jgi:hypothetical protein
VTAGTPKAVIDTLKAAAEKVIKSKELGTTIEKTGGGVKYIAPAEFRSTIERDKCRPGDRQEGGAAASGQVKERLASYPRSSQKKSVAFPSSCPRKRACRGK